MNTKTIYTILITIISIFLVSKGFSADPFAGIDSLVTDATTSITKIVVGLGILALVLYTGITMLSTRFDFRIEIFARLFIGVVIASLATTIIEWVVSFVG